MKKYLQIEGMTCQGCANRIKAAVEKLDFVRQAEVDYRQGSAIIKMPIEVPDEVLRETIEGLGYKVTSVERLLCGCKNVREADVRMLIKSGIDTPEALLEKTGIGSYGCCSKDIVPLLIKKYKNGEDIDIQSAVFKLNKRNDYIIAVNDAKRQLQSTRDNDLGDTVACH